MGYGTGAIFGCPAHDQRDLDFARRYGLPGRPCRAAFGEPHEGDVRVPVSEPRPCLSRRRDTSQLRVPRRPNGGGAPRTKWRAGWSSARVGGAPQAMREINYRLRDWGISRQRYWGCPIPMLHCETCGVVPVPRADLPVTLPEDIDFELPGQPARPPRGLAERRLPRPAAAPRNAKLIRWTPLSNSSWYFARFTAPHADDADRAGRSSTAGCPSTSISAAWSTRSCICSIRASSARAMRKTGHVGHGRAVRRACSRRAWSCTRPIANAAGEWVVARRGPHRGRRRLSGALSRAPPARRSRSARSRRCRSRSATRSTRPTSSASYGADTARWFMLSEFAARARRHLDRGGGRGRAPLRAAGLAPDRPARGRAAAAEHPASGDVRRGSAGAPAACAPHDRRGDEGHRAPALQPRGGASLRAAPTC